MQRRDIGLSSSNFGRRMPVERKKGFVGKGTAEVKGKITHTARVHGRGTGRKCGRALPLTSQPKET